MSWRQVGTPTTGNLGILSRFEFVMTIKKILRHGLAGCILKTGRSTGSHNGTGLLIYVSKPVWGSAVK